jgi:ABC-type Fe3+ transport system permease subunit
MMDRRVRVQIAIGLWTLAAGVAFAILAPIVTAAIFAPSRYPTNDDELWQRAVQLQSLARTLNLLAIAGWGVAACGFLLAFSTWTYWFVSDAPAAP